MKQIQVSWCENFIKAQFTKHHGRPGPNAGIEVNLFWARAEKSGLWVRGTYGSAMSIALSNLTHVETVLDWDGNYAYSVFKMNHPIENRN